ncbi:germinal-center associated nuclear protein [Trichonephila clavata]|uniref:Germinal-center associated nuclear protein n=1 Tax=Trichonephila clavata TaxID=2740835 RepID=A0A8X6K476_TRICU|nr:germinal-center associated nuclear protein [Trichonephila clavata]
MADIKCVVGMCLQMCSKREIEWRESKNLLHFFEINHAIKKEIKAHPTKVIKQYTRSAAGKELLSPTELRPSPILLKTVNYLINEIIPRTEIPWLVVYDFVNDRIQAIRQDMTVQRIEDHNAVEILEKCVRFYIIASYVLCEEPQNKFDQHLNSQQLSICLESLFTLYKKFKSNSCCEFIAIYLAENVTYAETYYRSISMFSDYLSKPYVKLSFRICSAYMDGNFVQFYRLVKRLPILILLCFFHLFNHVQIRALEVLNDAYSSNICKFPVQVLCSWLSVTQKHYMLELCQKCDIKIDGAIVCFNKKRFKRISNLSLKKVAFIDCKLQEVELSKLICGQT